MRLAKVKARVKPKLSHTEVWRRRTGTLNAEIGQSLRTAIAMLAEQAYAKVITLWYGLLYEEYVSCTIYKISCIPVSSQLISYFLKYNSWLACKPYTSFLINYLVACVILINFLFWSRWSGLNRRPTPSWIPLFSLFIRGLDCIFLHLRRRPLSVVRACLCFVYLVRSDKM